MTHSDTATVELNQSELQFLTALLIMNYRKYPEIEKTLLEPLLGKLGAGLILFATTPEEDELK